MVLPAVRSVPIASERPRHCCAFISTWRARARARTGTHTLGGEIDRPFDLVPSSLLNPVQPTTGTPYGLDSEHS
eukprot:3470957-Rhodomonas_salina.1